MKPHERKLSDRSVYKKEQPVAEGRTTELRLHPIFSAGTTKIQVLIKYAAYYFWEAARLYQREPWDLLVRALNRFIDSLLQRDDLFYE